MTPDEVLGIALAAKEAGDGNRLENAMMLLDIMSGRIKTPDMEEAEKMMFGTGGDCSLIDEEAKIWLLSRALTRGGDDDPGEGEPIDDKPPVLSLVGKAA